MRQRPTPQKHGDEDLEPMWLPQVGQTVDLNNLAVRKPEGWGGGPGERKDLLPLRSENTDMGEVIAVGKPNNEGDRLIRVRYPETPARAEVRMTHRFDKFRNLTFPNVNDE